ncbi:hypothetical protein SUDANB121_05807 [Nocardiopsis dassonvillei]|uniref:IS5 family transposase n=1 Tax=Nocardiopsis dassonvillei TaxID=2014 RepID=UPI003F5477A9
MTPRPRRRQRSRCHVPKPRHKCRMRAPVGPKVGPKGENSYPPPEQRIVNGILFRARTGVPWRDLPGRYGPWETVAGRHRRWSLDGTWQRIARPAAHRRRQRRGTHRRDRLHHRARPPARRRSGEKGERARDEPDGAEALGRSRGGLTTELHLLADTRRRPLVVLSSPGQRGDSLVSEPLMAALRLPRRVDRPRTRPDRVLGDKAYSSRAHRDHLGRRKIKATIAQPKDQRENRRRKGSAGGRPRSSTEVPPWAATPWSGASTCSSRTGRS